MPIKTVLFDFMGTCLDWHSSIVAVMPQGMDERHKSDFVLNWRQAYFDHNATLIAEGKPVEDFDDTVRMVLDKMLHDDKHREIERLFTTEAKQVVIAAWHHQRAWDDVSHAVKQLRHDLGLEAFVHANGTTRLQLDLVRSSGLQFDNLFSSEMLGVYKPAAENYAKMLRLIKREPAECVTVAAHAYDLRGAKDAGMKTVYIRRWTDDILEDQDIIKTENDAYLADMTDLAKVISEL